MVLRKHSYLRIIDANFNRAKEALRVIEEFGRFILEDRKLTARLKHIRHQVTQILLSYKISYEDLLKKRDSAGDLGRRSDISDKKKPVSKDIVIANFKRAQESMRVLEEISKIEDRKAAAKFQVMRFELYELERKAVCGF